MIRYNDLSKWFVATQDHVTAFLPFQVKTDFFEGFHAFPSPKYAAVHSYSNYHCIKVFVRYR